MGEMEERMHREPRPAPETARVQEAEIAARAAAGERQAMMLVTQENNRRLFRTAWSILRNDLEAEEVVQATYVKAWSSMQGFEGRSSLSTWLTRICVNEALQRRRQLESWRQRLQSGSIAVLDHYRERLMRGSMSLMHPEAQLARVQVRQLLEQAVARLPTKLRTVFVLREIEEMSVEDVAEALSIPAATVKTRHLRARLKLQDELSPGIRDVLGDTLPFAGPKCASMTEKVLAALGKAGGGSALGSPPAAVHES